MKKDVKKIVWDNIRETMCWDKKKVPVCFAEYIDAHGSKDCQLYVTNLEKAHHTISLAKDMKIRELEEKIRQLENLMGSN